MFEYETPTLMFDAAPLIFDELGVADMVLTLQHANTGAVLELYMDRLTVNGPLVTVTLTQWETRDLKGRVKAQLNVLCEDGRRIASDIVAFTIGTNLKEQEMQA